MGTISMVKGYIVLIIFEMKLLFLKNIVVCDELSITVTSY